ncbi:unnamed protein product [Heligmosomoides polygyrus]|uniref:G protein-coupled receptor n=1 Tax=Heligmosomoides polygyrus TaxID=6339 RepID=A0A183FEM3_HELPZ|nr:unnamed protein product [Heligmosomoides polygyrus]
MNYSAVVVPGSSFDFSFPQSLSVDAQMEVSETIFQRLYLIYMPCCVIIGSTGNAMVWILIKPYFLEETTRSGGMFPFTTVDEIIKDFPGYLHLTQILVTAAAWSLLRATAGLATAYDDEAGNWWTTERSGGGMAGSPANDGEPAAAEPATELRSDH